ncbi:MAG: hypothetical protein Q8J68_12970 [Methanolobus sp.]|uniref:hypothetical protein n=1 Tax=Methanolobus sp. TaxID=1874737 RepID=UPI0027312905|nr:hypothetical protein [Methanolobus sp.]MDP2218183.1 hypothetical protein [Methanolobus sp.]
MELLESFERDLTIRRRSIRTVQGYSKIIRKFLEYFPEPKKHASSHPARPA